MNININVGYLNNIKLAEDNVILTLNPEHG